MPGTTRTSIYRVCGPQHQACCSVQMRSEEGAVALWANPLLTTRRSASRGPNVLIYTDRYSAGRSFQLVRICARDHTISEEAGRLRSGVRRLSGAGDLDQGVHRISDDFSVFLHARNRQRLRTRFRMALTTLAEQLRAAGYVTASIVANPFAGRTTGLQRGFDYMFEYPVVLRNRTEAADRGTDSAAVNKIVFPWLERHRDEPFFLYAHATDPHAPYRPPPPSRTKFANPAETADFDRDYMKLRDRARVRRRHRCQSCELRQSWHRSRPVHPPGNRPL